jgi:hypothetical protein
MRLSALVWPIIGSIACRRLSQRFCCDVSDLYRPRWMISMPGLSASSRLRIAMICSTIVHERQRHGKRRNSTRSHKRDAHRCAHQCRRRIPDHARKRARLSSDQWAFGHIGAAVRLLSQVGATQFGRAGKAGSAPCFFGNARPASGVEKLASSRRFDPFNAGSRTRAPSTSSMSSGKVLHQAQARV